MPLWQPPADVWSTVRWHTETQKALPTGPPQPLPLPETGKRPPSEVPHGWRSTTRLCRRRAHSGTRWSGHPARSSHGPSLRQSLRLPGRWTLPSRRTSGPRCSTSFGEGGRRRALRRILPSDPAFWDSMTDRRTRASAGLRSHATASDTAPHAPHVLQHVGHPFWPRKRCPAGPFSLYAPHAPHAPQVEKRFLAFRASIAVPPLAVDASRTSAACCPQSRSWRRPLSARPRRRPSKAG